MQATLKKNLFFIKIIILNFIIIKSNTNQEIKFFNNFFKQGDLVFDVGANVGNKTNLFLLAGAKKVICIEPQPECINYLKHRFKDKSSTVIEEIALGSKSGKSELIRNSSQDVLATLSVDWTTYGRFANLPWGEKILVNINTLDEMIIKYGIPQFIKIDVENFELEVLKGLKKPVPCLSIEFAQEYLENTKKCINLLKTLGFDKYNFALGEDPKLILEEWVNSDNLIIQIENLIEKLNIKNRFELWGDIYCKNSDFF